MGSGGVSGGQEESEEDSGGQGGLGGSGGVGAKGPETVKVVTPGTGYDWNGQSYAPFGSSTQAAVDRPDWHPDRKGPRYRTPTWWDVGEGLRTSPQAMSVPFRTTPESVRIERCLQSTSLCDSREVKERGPSKDYKDLELFVLFFGLTKRRRCVNCARCEVRTLVYTPEEGSTGREEVVDSQDIKANEDDDGWNVDTVQSTQLSR